MRKLSEKEAERVARSLVGNGDELFQFAQVKATLRLLRDDETIDKDLRAYADRALSAQFNRLLKDAVPRVEKADRSVGEMLSVTDDPLLIAARGRRYLVKFSDITMPFEDLRYWALESGYALSTSESRSSTFISKEEGSRYRIKCPKCDEQAIRLIQRNGELVAISCANCRTKLVQAEKQEDEGPPQKRRPRASRRPG